MYSRYNMKVIKEVLCINVYIDLVNLWVMDKLLESDNVLIFKYINRKRNNIISE